MRNLVPTDSSVDDIGQSFDIETNNICTNTSAVQLDQPINHNNNTREHHNQIKYAKTHTGNLSIHELMRVQSEIAAKYESCPKEIKMFVAGLSIKLKDITTKGGQDLNEFDTNNKQELNLNQHMTDIIHNYKNSFAGQFNSFASSNDGEVFRVNKCSKSMLHSQSKKRLKSNKEKATIRAC